MFFNAALCTSNDYIVVQCHRPHFHSMVADFMEMMMMQQTQMNQMVMQQMMLNSTQRSNSLPPISHRSPVGTSHALHGGVHSVEFN